MLQFPSSSHSKNSGSILQALWAMAGNIITDQKGSLEALPLDFRVYFFYIVLLLHSSFFSLPIKNTGAVLNHVQLFVTPWIAVCQAPLSMGFSRQEYWSRLPVPTPGHLPDPGIKPATPVSPPSADSLPRHHLGSPSKSGLQTQYLPQEMEVLLFIYFFYWTWQYCVCLRSPCHWPRLLSSLIPDLETILKSLDAEAS